ncbi:MAG: hypothetical protein ACOCQG_02750 [Candidatus Nanoarchaeia archaeon]
MEYTENFSGVPQETKGSDGTKKQQYLYTFVSSGILWEKRS